MTIGKKQNMEDKIFKYLSNPENAFVPRSQLAIAVLKYKRPHSLYKMFTPDELTRIENEALVERKKRVAPQRSTVYDTLYNKCTERGDISACKEWLDRVEGKVTQVFIEKKETIEDIIRKLEKGKFNE